MAEPFKNFINAQVVDSAARHLARAWPAFDARRFRALALAGLDGLELKARAQHLCAALEVTLPSDFAQAAAIIEASLAPVRGDEDLAGSHSADDGLTGWVERRREHRCASLGQIFGHTSALGIHGPKSKLSKAIALGGCLLEEAHRMGVIVGHASALDVHDPEVGQGCTIALGGGLPDKAQCLGVIVTLIGREAALEDELQGVLLLPTGRVLNQVANRCGKRCPPLTITRPHCDRHLLNNIPHWRTSRQQV